MCQSFSKKSPEPLLMPRRAGTWPTMIVSARPTMKPFSTGSEMRLATKPSRARPATRPIDPGGDRERDRELGEPRVPCVAITATVAAESAAVADIGPTTRCLELPKAAYRSSAAGAAYRPVTGGTPAIDGVGERLGHEHRPHGRARNRVRSQKLAPVPSQGGEEDELHRGAGIRISCSAREPAAGRRGRMNIVLLLEACPARLAASVAESLTPVR